MNTVVVLRFSVEVEERGLCARMTRTSQARNDSLTISLGAKRPHISGVKAQRPHISGVGAKRPHLCREGVGS